MKKLIFALILLSSLTYAVDENEMNTAVTKKVMSVVQDAKVEEMLNGATEFKKCRDDNAIKPKDTADVRSKKLDIATKCFAREIRGKEAGAIQKLSSTLQLENYGLVKTKNVNDITEYLTKKMIKSLTGVDPDEKDHQKIIEQLKWENQKIVDQKVFIDLHVNQLMKSALFEVSRFCIENFRVYSKTPISKSDKSDFFTHWSSKWDAIKKINDSPPILPAIDGLTDTGDIQSSFLNLNTGDLSDKTKTYSALAKSLAPVGAQLDADSLGNFYTYCMKAIPLLCTEFKNSQGVQKSAANQVTDVAVGSGMTKGANSCLTMEKLKSIRTALSNSQKVATQFKEYQKTDKSAAIAMLTDPDFYQGGKGSKGEESLDSLTSYTSADMLGDGDEKIEKLEKDCAINLTKECDDFLVKTDALDNAVSNVEISMNLKRELELGNIEKIISRPDDVKKYLEENAHFEMLEQIKLNPSLTSNAAWLKDELSKSFDAKKVAEIQALKAKIGKRQMNEDDYNKSVKDGTNVKTITDNIKESKEERARLAQVVMFNNIITSQLELEDKDTGKKVGRNVTAWNKEDAVLTQNKDGYDENLFKGLKASADKNGTKLEDASVVGGGIIDSILGKK